VHVTGFKHVSVPRYTGMFVVETCKWEVSFRICIRYDPTCMKTQTQMITSTDTRSARAANTNLFCPEVGFAEGGFINHTRKINLFLQISDPAEHLC